MKLLFAGTSHGVPEADRFCSSIFVQLGEKTYIVDAGAPISSRLRHYGIPHHSVQGIFVTHLHGDHFNGLTEFCDLITWYFKDTDPQILLPEERGVQLLETWTYTILPIPPEQRKPLRCAVYTPGVIYDDGTLRVTARPTRHTAHSNAFLLEAEGKRVLITGDMSRNYPEYPDLLNGEAYDLVICEAAHHECYADLAPMFAAAHTKRMIVTHINPVKLDGIERLRPYLPFAYDLAYDGMTVEL